MSFHRTGGQGGTRNSPREKHCDRYLPNFNKSTSGGHSRRPRKGKRMDNPGPGSSPKDSPRKKYDAMMKKARAGIKPRQSLGNRILAGKSDVL